eukprot:Anaeramoba_flamelloidesa587570_7.p1 GENE.a587570_7~~a587570_7.p1  ORF type:complete len:142 (-),score=40.54 a587570_7:17-442(-)
MNVQISILYFFGPKKKNLNRELKDRSQTRSKKKVICALIGKLGKALVGSQSLGDLLSTNISTCLEYVISYICYLGEKDFIENKIPNKTEKKKKNQKIKLEKNTKKNVNTTQKESQKKERMLRITKKRGTKSKKKAENKNRK